MSRTSLYRKLKAEGSSFSRLLDEERQKVLIARQYDSVAILCDLLGFRDVSAYYKARKRWEFPKGVTKKVAMKNRVNPKH